MSAETGWSRGQGGWSLLRGQPESSRERVLVHGQHSRGLGAGKSPQTLRPRLPPCTPSLPLHSVGQSKSSGQPD